MVLVPVRIGVRSRAVAAWKAYLSNASGFPPKERADAHTRPAPAVLHVMIPLKDSTEGITPRQQGVSAAAVLALGPLDGHGKRDILYVHARIRFRGAQYPTTLLNLAKDEEELQCLSTVAPSCRTWYATLFFLRNDFTCGESIMTATVPVPGAPIPGDATTPRGAMFLEIASKTGRVVYTLQSAAPTNMLRLRGAGASISTEPLEKEVEIEYDAKRHGELEPRFERTRDIQYGERLPPLTPTPARPRVGDYRWVTRLGLPLPTFPKSGYMSMSEDMLGEFDRPVMHHWSPRSVDLHYGRLLSKDEMYNFVEHLGQRQILMFLHRRAAAMGVNLRLVTRTEVVPLYYEYAGTHTERWHHFTLTRRLSLGPRVEFDADLRLCLNGAKRVHREIDAHFITLLNSGVAALYVEPWHRLVDDHEVGIVVDPNRGHSFNEECCRFHEAAPNTSLFAFDVEGDRVGDYLAVIGIKDELSGRFDVFMESAPYPILGGLFARPECRFLVWGGKESAWLLEVGIPFIPEQLIDLQARYERPNDSLEGHHVGDDAHWVPPAKSRRIDEALWLLRAGEHERIFAKSGCGNTFFFPDGPPPMSSIWSVWPLALDHIKYAAGDVIALFLLNKETVVAAVYF